MIHYPLSDLVSSCPVGMWVMVSCMSLRCLLPTLLPVGRAPNQYLLDSFIICQKHLSSIGLLASMGYPLSYTSSLLWRLLGRVGFLAFCSNRAHSGCAHVTWEHFGIADPRASSLGADIEETTNIIATPI